MSSLSAKIRTALYAKLNVASVVGSGKASAVYHQVAPLEAVYPFIVFNRVPGLVNYAFQNTNHGERDIWFIKCLSDKGVNSAKSPQELNDEILLLAETAIGNTLTISGATVSRVTRIADIPEIIETISDRDIFQHGFQLEVYASPN